MTKEAEINNKKYGEDSLITVKLSIKNLIIVIGFIISTVTGGYFALKSDINGLREDVKTGRSETKNDIAKIKDEDLKVIYNQVNQIDGKVQTILMLKGNESERIEKKNLPDLGNPR
jgi:hypothetical protein